MTNASKTKIIREILPSLQALMSECKLCPRNCGVNRTGGERGVCDCGNESLVYTVMEHKGEEPPISAYNGSGAIFFSGCGMKCVYCQNHVFSQHLLGEEMSARRLGEIFLELEKKGCHNINLVNPTYFLPSIVEALGYAFSEGLNLPVVYNTGGYENIEIIKMLDGLVDIYLPDMRYSEDSMALKYSSVRDYVKINREVVKEMYRQTGGLEVRGGIAIRGLIIRLLVLPGGVSGTIDSLEFIAREIGKKVSISLMSQYYPTYDAKLYGVINRKITKDEYDHVVKKAFELGLDSGWIQPFGGNFDEAFLGENF